MPVYNGERYLSGAVESVLNQTFSDFEFIIVDDGSTDRTNSILSAYAKQDSRIRLLTHPKNLGLTAALNRGIDEARGDYLARMDADDLCHAERLARQVSYLDAHAECGVLGTSYYRLDANGDRGLACHYQNDPIFLQWYLCFQNPLAHASVMVRTRHLREANGYRESARYAEDYDLWWRLSSQTKFGCLPELLMDVRYHSASVSQVHAHQQMKAKYAVLQEMLPAIAAAHLCPLLQTPVTPDMKRRYVIGILKVFEKRASVSADALARIREDAACRLAVIAAIHPLASAGALLDSLRIDATVPRKILGSAFDRYIRETAWNPILK